MDQEYILNVDINRSTHDSVTYERRSEGPKAGRDISSSYRKWTFDLVDQAGEVVGGGFVVACSPRAALAHATLLAGNNAPRLRDFAFSSKEVVDKTGIPSDDSFPNLNQVA